LARVDFSSSESIAVVILSARWRHVSRINQWGLNWIWAVFTLIFVAWRFLLVKWTHPVVGEIEATIGEVKAELTPPDGDSGGNVEEIIERIIIEPAMIAQFGKIGRLFGNAVRIWSVPSPIYITPMSSTPY
jgi:hypothetical protein